MLTKARRKELWAIVKAKYPKVNPLAQERDFDPLDQTSISLSIEKVKGSYKDTVYFDLISSSDLLASCCGFIEFSGLERLSLLDEVGLALFALWVNVPTGKAGFVATTAKAPGLLGLSPQEKALQYAGFTPVMSGLNTSGNNCTLWVLQSTKPATRRYR